MFSDNNGIQVEINNRKMAGKITKYLELYNILLNMPWVE